MSEPKKHHYLPEVYLQRFAVNKSGDLFVLKVKGTYKSLEPEKKNKSQICYEINKYKYQTEDVVKANNLNDPNIIEKEKFKYEENELSKLFDKMDHSHELFLTEVKRIIEILLNIKRRNPSYSNAYLDYKGYKLLLNTHSERLRRELTEAGIDLDEATAILDRARAKLIQNLKDKDYVLDLYRNSLLNHDEEIEKQDAQLINRLLNWNLTVFQTEYNNPFVTSDNPGYTLRSLKEVYNMNFDYIDGFAFPISPKSLLYLSKAPIIKHNLFLYKEVIYKKATNEIVLLFNNGTAINSNNHIISNMKEQLTVTAGFI